MQGKDEETVLKVCKAFFLLEVFCFFNEQLENLLIF